MKVLILIFITFLLTGCNVDYKLNIDDEFNLEETTMIEATTNFETTKFNEYNSYLPVDIKVADYSLIKEKKDGINYYNLDKSDGNLTFDYIFDISNYKNSMIAGSTYDNILVTKADDVLTLSTTSEFLPFDSYPNLDEVKITITSNYEFIKCNGDVVGKHECVWNIDKDNAYNKNIFLRLDTTKRRKTIDDFINTEVLILLGIFVVIGLILGIHIYKRMGMKNKI